MQNNVDEHRRTCKKITYWVKRSVLNRDEPDRRSLSLKYFINTALVSHTRDLHTFCQIHRLFSGRSAENCTTTRSTLR